MCLFPRTIICKLKDGTYTKMQVPCGKCIECLQVRTHDWEFRLQRELKDSAVGLFLTLTYEDYFLPKDGVTVRDLQCFFKRLRNRDLSFSYYAIGEYGTNFQRPHYHVLLFVKSFLNYADLLLLVHSCWSYGFVTISPMYYGRIHYCVAYLIGSKFPIDKNKPFTVMSKRPAIGSSLLDDTTFVEELKRNEFHHIYKHGKKVHCPRFFKKKLSNDIFTFKDLIPIYCNRCKKEYDSKVKWLKTNKVSNVKLFLGTPIIKYCKNINSYPPGIVDDFTRYLRHKEDHAYNKDFILKQRAKKLRND